MRYKKLSIHVVCCALASPLVAIAADNQKTSPWAIELEAGLGYDSNAYLAPSDSYVDYAVSTTPTVDPTKHSGVFIPLNASVDYDGRGNRNQGFIWSYSFDGNFYPESDTDNANEYNHTLLGGMEFLLNRNGKREDTLRVTPYFGVHDKTYFNRDTGDEMITSGGTDLSDRYSYNITGIKAELKHETARFPHSIHANLARLDYVDPTSTIYESYDHNYFRVGGDLELPIVKLTKLTLRYDYSNRDYDERNARDLSGNLISGTTRQYIYNKIGASLRQKVNRDLAFYVDFDITDRKDDYVGYYDYTQTGFGLRAIYGDSDKLRIRAKATWWDRDYDKAFAFDNPTQADMTLESAEYSIKGDYALANGRGLWAEFKSVDRKSTDLRYDYDRYEVMAGWRWEQ